MLMIMDRTSVPYIGVSGFESQLRLLTPHSSQWRHWKTANGDSSTLVTVTYEGNPDGVPDSWFQHGLVLAVLIFGE